MAVLLPLEQRDSKGNVQRYNPSVTFIAAKDIRTPIGRHDWRLEKNSEYHPPITVQVQNGELKFFIGTPDTTATRAAAKEISVADVDEAAPYITAELRARPLRFREPRPMVYEVRLATIGDVTVAEAHELAGDGMSVTVSAQEPDLDPTSAAGRAALAAAPQELDA